MIVLDEPGRDDNLGPTHPKLNEFYRKRLLDPKLKPEYKRRMDVISSCRPRNVTLYKIDGDEEGFEYFAMDVQYEEATVEVEMVKDQILNLFSCIKYY